MPVLLEQRVAAQEPGVIETRQHGPGFIQVTPGLGRLLSRAAFGSAASASAVASGSSAWHRAAQGCSPRRTRAWGQAGTCGTRPARISDDFPEPDGPTTTVRPCS
ncbi:MAG TPA: hypothetical protein VNM90_20445 [Haliangium sp.]|nr:hypothetical protein [Haliangium sp.]